MSAVSAAVPLIDREDFADLLAAGRLGRWSPQANELHHRGFCTLDIGDEDTHQDCHELVDVFEKQLAQELEDWEAGRMGSTRIQDAWRQHPAARRLALHPSVLDLLRQVYGRDPFAFQTLNFAVGSEQPYHSDAVHFHSEPKGFMCGVWIPLADVEPDSGPLIYYPGSHRLPYLSAASLGLSLDQVAAECHPQSFFEPGWQDAIKQLQLEPEFYLPRRGQALIWHANLLHGGSPVANRHARRWSQVVHFFFADCLYTTPLLSFSEDQGGLSLRNPVDIASGCKVWTPSRWARLELSKARLPMQSRGVLLPRAMPRPSWFCRSKSQSRDQAPSLKGNLELISPALVTGWAYHHAHSITEVRLVFGSRTIARALIDGDRPDVASSLGVSGPLGFQLEIPDSRPDLRPGEPAAVFAVTGDGCSYFLLRLPGASEPSTPERLRLALDPKHRGKRGHFDGLSPTGNELVGWCTSTQMGPISIWLHAEGLPSHQILCCQHRPGMAAQGIAEHCGFVLPLSEWPEALGCLVWASFDEAGELRIPPLRPLRLPENMGAPLCPMVAKTDLESVAAGVDVIDTVLTTSNLSTHDRIASLEQLQAHWQALEEFRALIDRVEHQVRQAEALPQDGVKARLPVIPGSRILAAFFNLWR